MIVFISRRFVRLPFAITEHHLVDMAVKPLEIVGKGFVALGGPLQPAIIQGIHRRVEAFVGDEAFHGVAPALDHFWVNPNQPIFVPKGIGAGGVVAAFIATLLPHLLRRLAVEAVFGGLR